MKELCRSRSAQSTAVLIIFCTCLLRQVWVGGDNVEGLIAGIVAVLANHAINKRKQIQSTGEY